jgi:phosphoribosylformylglycinamidine synthase
LILRAPGTNCDLETAHAFELAGANCERLHVNRLLESPGAMNQFQILCLPGGFSFGDDLAAGRILGSLLRRHLGEAMRQFKDAGKLILGICNGFQILMKSGLLLPDAQDGSSPLTLAWNRGGRFEARWVTLRVANSKAIFFQGIERLYLPIAHAEGRIAANDAGALAALDRSGQIALRYAAADGTVPPRGALASFPDNPNGAADNIAGLCDSTGRVCGLMPHPERHVDVTQHPHWTRRKEQPAAGDGLAVFRNAVAYFG